MKGRRWNYQKVNGTMKENECQKSQNSLPQIPTVADILPNYQTCI
jgi:hypothetical protein